MAICFVGTALLAFACGMLTMAVLLQGRGPMIREDEL